MRITEDALSTMSLRARMCQEFKTFGITKCQACENKCVYGEEYCLRISEQIAARKQAELDNLVTEGGEPLRKWLVMHNADKDALAEASGLGAIRIGRVLNGEGRIDDRKLLVQLVAEGKGIAQRNEETRGNREAPNGRSRAQDAEGRFATPGPEAKTNCGGTEKPGNDQVNKLDAEKLCKLSLREQIEKLRQSNAEGAEPRNCGATEDVKRNGEEQTRKAAETDRAAATGPETEKHGTDVAEAELHRDGSTEQALTATTGNAEQSAGIAEEATKETEGVCTARKRLRVMRIVSDNAEYTMSPEGRFFIRNTVAEIKDDIPPGVNIQEWAELYREAIDEAVEAWRMMTGGGETE